MNSCAVLIGIPIRKVDRYIGFILETHKIVDYLTTIYNSIFYHKQFYKNKTDNSSHPQRQYIYLFDSLENTCKHTY